MFYRGEINEIGETIGSDGFTFYYKIRYIS